MKEDLRVLAEDVLDFVSGIEAACVKLKMQIDKNFGPEIAEYDLEKISWFDAEGSSGPYQRSEDVNSQDFRALLKDLNKHEGKMQKDSFFIWVL